MVPATVCQTYLEKKELLKKDTKILWILQAFIIMNKSFFSFIHDLSDLFPCSFQVEGVIIVAVYTTFSIQTRVLLLKCLLFLVPENPNSQAMTS